MNHKITVDVSSNIFNKREIQIFDNYESAKNFGKEHIIELDWSDLYNQYEEEICQDFPTYNFWRDDIKKVLTIKISIESF